MSKVTISDIIYWKLTDALDYFRWMYHLLTYWWLGILIWWVGCFQQLLIMRYNSMSNSVIYRDQCWEQTKIHYRFIIDLDINSLLGGHDKSKDFNGKVYTCKIYLNITAVLNTFGVRRKLKIKKFRITFFFNKPHSEVFTSHYSDRTITQNTPANLLTNPHHPHYLVNISSSCRLWSFQYYTWSFIKIIRLVT